MEKDAKEALQVTKEILVKFIETGRVSPTNFSEIFPSIYRVVLATINRSDGIPEQGQPNSGSSENDGK